MSHHSRNWLKFGSLVALAFVLGLFFAGLLNFPRTSFAQGSNSDYAPIVPVSAPRIPAARPLADLSEAFSAIAEAVRPSVVFIESSRPVSARPEGGQPAIPPGLEKLFPEAVPPQDGLERATGSGFIVSADGFILTNHHVIEGASEVKVRLLDGRVFRASVVGSDKTTDVGVLKIDADHLTPAALGSSAAVRVGEWVLAIGNPLGDNLTFSVTQGIVSAKGRGLGQSLTGSDRDIQDFIQTDAAINKGNSGGPLINVRGQVIGINSAIASFTGFYAGYAFAVPIDLATAVMNQIIAHGRVQRTGMGVYVRNIDETDAIYLGLDSIAGVKVDNYADDSPAKRAGIKPGDVITAIDGRPVSYVAQLQQLVGFRRAGDEVRVTVVGASGSRDYTVRLINTGPSEAVTSAPTPEPAPVAANEQNPLGVAIEVVTPTLATRLKLPASTKGLLVASVAPNSPAEQHLCPADNPRACLPEVITSIEGKPVRTESEFKAALAGGGRHGVVSVTVLRADGQQLERTERIRIKQE